MIIEGVEVKYMRMLRYTTKRQVTAVPGTTVPFVYSLFAGETIDVEAYVDERTRAELSELLTWPLVLIVHEGKLLFGVLQQERSRYVSPAYFRTTLTILLRGSSGTFYLSYLTDLEEVENDWGV